MANYKLLPLHRHPAEGTGFKTQKMSGRMNLGICTPHIAGSEILLTRSDKFPLIQGCGLTCR